MIMFIILSENKSDETRFWLLLLFLFLSSLILIIIHCRINEAIWCKLLGPHLSDQFRVHVFRSKIIINQFHGHGKDCT